MKKNGKQNNQGNHINHLNHSSDNGDMSEWKETQIKNFGRVITGFTPNTNNHELWDGEVPFYTPADFHDDVYCSKTERKISEKALSNDRIVQENSLLVTCIASIGKIALAKSRGISNQQINAIIFNDDFDPKYCYYLIKLNINELLKLAGITAVPIVNKTEFGKITLKHHSDKSEQRQIARILSTADAMIEKTQASISKYKAIKQGMLHDLFTRGIDLSTGKLRPKYEDAPELYKSSKLGMVPREWETEKLGNYSFVTKLAGFEYTLYFDYSKSGPIIAVRALNIKQGKLALDNIHTIPKETADILPRSQLQKGDLVISYVGTVGEVAVIPENNKFHLAPNVAKISVDKKNVDPFYLNQFLNADIGQNEIIKLVSSTTQAALSMQNLREVKFLRLDLKEQKEIANRLETIDNNIENEQIYFKKLQQIKAGLMGDLLSGRKKVQVEEEVNNTNFNSIEFDAFKNQC